MLKHVWVPVLKLQQFCRTLSLGEGIRDKQNWVKGTVSRDFFASGFLHQPVSPNPRGPFRVFSKIRGDIRKSRCTTGINDTGGKFCHQFRQCFARCTTGINDTGGNLPLVSTTPVAICKASRASCKASRARCKASRARCKASRASAKLQELDAKLQELDAKLQELLAKLQELCKASRARRIL